MKNFDCNRFHHPYHAYNQHSCSSRSGGGSNNNNHGGPHHNNSISHNNGYHPYQQQPTRHQQQQHQTQQQQQLAQLPTYFNYHQRHAQQQQQPQLQQQLNQQLQHFNNSSPLQQHQQQNLMTTSATTAAVAATTSASSASSDSAASLPSLLLSSATACNQRPNTLNIQGATYANFIANYNQNNNNNNHPNNNNNNTNINGTCGNNNNNSNNNSSNNNSNINITNLNIQHVVNQQQQQQKQQKQQQQLQSQVQQQQQQEDAAVASATTVDKFTMDACEIANFLANELFMQQQLVSVDGIQSGVPTLTTPTLTPTTLRSIEETFIQMTSEPNNAPYQAGFIPPPLAPFPSLANTSSLGDGSVLQAITTFSSIQDYNDNLDTESEDSQASWNEAQLHEENSQATTDTSSAATDSTSYQNGLNGMGNNSLATSTTSSTNDFSSMNIAIAAAAAAAKNGGLLTSTPNNKNTSHSATSSTTTTRRNQGGRRPTKSANMSPEEEEKRRIRRERNKLAAARCRKRRVDQTNELLDEVAVLENKRASLQNDIETLTQTKQELEYILEAHRPTCQKERQDILTVSTFGGLIAPVSSSASNASASITGLDPTLAATGRSISPIELKPDILPDNMLDVVQHIKNEPIDSALDSGSSLDGPPSPKRILLTRNNPMIPPPLPLPHVATLSPSLAAASASLNTPIVTSAPVSFGSFSNSNATLNTLNALNNKPPNGSKQRPNSLPGVPRNLGQNLGLNVVGKNPTDINGVAIQTPSTGMFNFDSLMDGGTGLTPVSGPLVPTCSSQNKHPLELTTPTSEPSKLVSL